MMKHSILALAAYVLLTLIATHPLWQHLADSVPGDIGDPVLNTYIIAWDTHALVNDPLKLFNANIFYPLPNTLAYSENLIGDALLALPIALISAQPVVAYNFTFGLSFGLASFGMYLFVLRLTRQRATAFVAGVAFGFAPYRVASLAHIQLLTVAWLPFIAYGLWRIADRSSTCPCPVPRATARRQPCGLRHRMTGCNAGAARRDGRSRQLRITNYVLLFTFLWLQIASSLHGALFAALIVLTFLSVYVSRNLRRLLPITTYILPFAFFLLTLLPIVLPYFSILSELRAARPPGVALSFLAQPSDFLAAYPWNRLFGAMTDVFRQRDGFTDEQTLFAGIVAPLLALVGALNKFWKASRKPYWDLGSFDYAQDKFGVWDLTFWCLMICGVLLATSSWLVQALPLASIMRVPARWGGGLTFALAGLCGIAVSGFVADKRMGSTLQRRVLHPLIAILIFAEGFSAPIPLAYLGAPQAQPAVYQYLAQTPGHEAVIELPMYVAPDAEFPEAKRMVASALHWRPLVNGYSGFTPPRQMRLAAQLKNFPDDASLAALRDLAREGVRYLIVHSGEPGIPRRAWVQANRARAIASGVLRLVQSFNDDDLFEIVP